MHVLLVVLTLISLFIYNIIQSVVLFLTPKKYRKKKDIEGQKVLITGAGNGLGRQLAIQFSKLSTCLILLDINKKALVETSKQLHPKSRVFIYECDITNRIMVYATAKIIKDDVGEVDIIVNNAGVVNEKSLIDLSDDKIIRTLEVNAISHFWICKSFLPSMMARDRGHIVTIASVAGEVGVPRLTDYCASKHAAIGFSESLELEMQVKNLDGIKVTIVCPAVINTGLFERLQISFESSLTPEYVAQEIVEGVLEEKEKIYLPHYFMYIIWLKSISPRWLYRSFLKISGNMNIMDDLTERMNSAQRIN